MRYFILLFLFYSLKPFAQEIPRPPSNEELYRPKDSTIHYSYDNKTQTLNFSNNWDFDNDGVNDQFYWVGLGGAHLYFFLRIVLSSDDKARDFEFIQTDFPFLYPDVASISYHGPFCVFDNGNDNIPDIFIQINEHTFRNWKKVLKKKNVTTTNILITFKKRRAIFKDYDVSN